MKSSKNLYKEFLAIYFKYLTVDITINEITIFQISGNKEFSLQILENYIFAKILENWNNSLR